ncbi:MAG: metallophosphoesterase [Defluviitaleaceae bacterium]|nr:metallophosphoesterase [Defluviitaleaceae bacterium]
MKKAGIIILITLIVFLGAAATIAALSSRWVKVYEHVVYFDNLPAHLEGFRILHLSDLHSNHETRINVNIWPHIDRLDFDMAAITGDIVLDGGWRRADAIVELNPHKDGLAALAARVPTFFVEGNHESAHVNRFAPIMADLGIYFLRNDAHFLKVGEGYLEIIGAMEYSVMRRTTFLGLEWLLANTNPDFRLILTHQPQLFDRVKNHGQMLVLAGHTHGGQLRLPFLPTLYAPGQGLFPRYGNGFYEHENAALYVSRGIGTTYFPFRFWNRPVITVLELRQSQHP